MNVVSPNWQEANQNYLMTALRIVREALEAYVSKRNGELISNPTEIGKDLVNPNAFLTNFSRPPALEQLCSTFGLSSFERDVLLLCAGMELDAMFPSLCAAAQGDSQRAFPTLGLALATFSVPQWKALMPTSPLRRWRMIEIGAGSALTLSPLRIDERILHYLTGFQYLDERLAGIIEPLAVSEKLVPSHQELAQALAATWSQASQTSNLPIVQLCGEETISKRAIAFSACELVGLKLNVINGNSIPLNFSELNQLIRLWEREYWLRPSALLIDCDELDVNETNRENAIALLSESNSPLIIISRDRRRSRLRPLITYDVRPASTDEQRLLWHNALDTTSQNGHVETLVSHFSLSAPTIHAICAEAKGRLAQASSYPQPPTLSTLLWDTCRSHARPRLNDLAQHIESASTWDDLVLPERERQTLRDIAAHVQQRSKVYENWGFGGKSGRGLGISALFAGASGTGKTMAADILAQELRLDLYRIDLSSVVSKYIGETEKNLRRVFDAAEAGGAILLFDEADALFGKRSEVKDSHDRYANMEVSYLLQRMEAYRGLAILTTNLKDALDTAFLRRIRFIIRFPFPDAAQRAEIWQRIFPSQTPTADLDVKKLSRLNVAGGNIRNIALNAAFIAAAAGEPVSMKHLLSAAQGEYIKLERPITDAEVKGWV